MNKLAIVLLLINSTQALFGQTTNRLTLEQAKTIALTNHPQILAAQDEAAYTEQQVIASRAPYFHNGSAMTLSNVVQFYNVRFNIGLTEAEKADLVAFLNAL